MGLTPTVRACHDSRLTGVITMSGCRYFLRDVHQFESDCDTKNMVLKEYIFRFA